MKVSYEKNPSEIIDKLLEYHDIKKLQAILNSRARKKEPRGNTYLTIATAVYFTKDAKDSKLEWAIETIADEKSITAKTVKNHITSFRKEIKTLLTDGAEVNKFIKDYISEIGEVYDFFDINTITYSNCKYFFDQVSSRYMDNNHIQTPPPF